MGKSQTEKLREAVEKQGSKIVGGSPGENKDIPEVTEEKEEKSLSPIYQQVMGIDNIIPNPESQEIYGDDPVDDLIESIEDSGLLIPVLAILVEPEKTMLVSGYRRWKAFGILRDRFNEAHKDDKEPPENPYQAIPIDWWHGDRENEVEVLKAVLETNVARVLSEDQKLGTWQAWKKVFEAEGKERKSKFYHGREKDPKTGQFLSQDTQGSEETPIGLQMAPNGGTESTEKPKKAAKQASKKTELPETTARRWEKQKRELQKAAKGGDERAKEGLRKIEEDGAKISPTYQEWKKAGRRPKRPKSDKFSKTFTKEAPDTEVIGFIKECRKKIKAKEFIVGIEGKK